MGVIDVLFVGGGGGAEAFLQNLPLLVVIKMGRGRRLMLLVVFFASVFDNPPVEGRRIR